MKSTFRKDVEAAARKVVSIMTGVDGGTETFKRMRTLIRAGRGCADSEAAIDEIVAIVYELEAWHVRLLIRKPEDGNELRPGVIRTAKFFGQIYDACRRYGLALSCLRWALLDTHITV